MRDDFDSVVADRFTVLDDVPVPDTWSRVLDRVPVAGASSLAWNEDDGETIVDLETSISTERRRKRPVRVLAAILSAAAAAVAVAIAVVVIRDHDVTPADRPSPTVPPTTPPQAMPNSGGDPLEPGTYYVDDVNGLPTPRIYGTLDSGWYDLDARPGWTHIAKGRPQGPPPGGAIGFVEFTNPVAVYSDACHPTDGFYPGTVATVDGLITALREQQGGWVDVTVPTDISVDGYVGKAFQRTAPAVISDDCTGVDFPSWVTADEINSHYEPGQIETLWVLDVDGTVVVINTELWPGPSAAAHADFADAVLDSIRIDRP